MKSKLPYILVIILFLATRLPLLGRDISNSDAARWHRRSEDFLTALKTGDLAATYQHYQPGVTLMWINAATKLVVGQIQNDPTKTLENADWFPVIDGISKSVLVFVLLGLLLLQMYLVGIIFGRKSAAIYGILLSLEPYSIGIDRWFHLTSLETYLGFSAFLLLLVWNKYKLKRWLVLSAVILALSILSKLTTLVLVPFFILLIFIRTRNVKTPLLYLAYVFATFFLLFPALWVDFFPVLSKLINAITNAVGNDIRAHEVPPLMHPIFYPVVLLLKLSPVTVLFLFAGILSIKRVKLSSEIKMVAIFLLYYLLILTIPEKKIDRYALVLFPPVILLISTYVSTFAQKWAAVVLGLSALFLVYVYFSVFPVFSAYYSPLFGGTKTAHRLKVYDNSGEYFAQAAFYLNTKGRDLATYVPDNVESFSYFYEGILKREYDREVDYIVKSIDIDRPKVTDEHCPIVEQTFGTNDYDVVYVFLCLNDTIYP